MRVAVAPTAVVSVGKVKVYQDRVLYVDPQIYFIYVDAYHIRHCATQCPLSSIMKNLKLHLFTPDSFKYSHHEK